MSTHCFHVSLPQTINVYPGYAVVLFVGQYLPDSRTLLFFQGFTVVIKYENRHLPRLFPMRDKSRVYQENLFGPLRAEQGRQYQVPQIFARLNVGHVHGRKIGKEWAAAAK